MYCIYIYLSYYLGCCLEILIRSFWKVRHFYFFDRNYNCILISLSCLARWCKFVIIGSLIHWIHKLKFCVNARQNLVFEDRKPNEYYLLVMANLNIVVVPADVDKELAISKNSRNPTYKITSFDKEEFFLYIFFKYLHVKYSESLRNHFNLYLNELYRKSSHNIY